MKKKLFYIMITVSIICVPMSRIVSADSYEKGKSLYEQKCQICHGLKGNGKGPAAAAFSSPPADFTAPKFWQQKDIDQTITRTIQGGHGSMPAFDLNSEEIQSIIDYLSRTFKPRM
jgi:mono/diheme cytochrome c family protein